MAHIAALRAFRIVACRRGFLDPTAYSSASVFASPCVVAAGAVAGIFLVGSVKVVLTESKSVSTEKPASNLPQRKLPWNRTAAYLQGMKDECIGLDIGGTASKVAILQLSASDSHVLSEEQFGYSGKRVKELETPCPSLGGTLHFIKWDTQYTEKSLRGIIACTGEKEKDDGFPVFATGGGAYKFQDLFSVATGMRFEKMGEFDALIDGLRVILNHMPDSIYCIAPDGTSTPGNFCNKCFNSGRFPILVCNIGTGVSMIKVASHDAERVGGTSIGGSTFLGLVYQLTSARTFKEAMHLAQEGDPAEVDLLVSDIYGAEGGKELNLEPTLTASSFGRLTRQGDGNLQPSDAAMASSVCNLVTQAIALYACQVARRHDVREVFFTGGFLENNDLAKRKLSFFVNREYARSEGEGRAYFLHHAEYAGALGCLSHKIDTMRPLSLKSTSRRLNH